MSSANSAAQSDKRRDASVTHDPRRPKPVEVTVEVADATAASKEKKEKHSHDDEDDALKQEKKEKKREKKEKKRREAEAEGTTLNDAEASIEAAVAEAEASDDGGDKAKKDRKREKKERKERERLEREQAERDQQAQKDAAVVAAASVAQAQALSAVASAPRLPTFNIDPLLGGEAASVEAAAEDVSTQPAQVDMPTADAETEEGAPKKGKGKRGRPAKTHKDNDDDEADGDYAAKKKPRGGRAKSGKSDNFESLRDVPPRELLVDRVYSSDTLKKLEREIGLKYKKGRFTADEERILKDGIEDFKKRKGYSDEMFQDLLYNYKARGWEREFTELWKDLTGRLEDRANISVRLHIKTRYSQYRNKGKYTLAEDHEIRYRLGELKEDIGAVAKRLGRLGQDISSRWVKLQVRDEMISGPAFTPEEDEAVMEALEKHKREHPDELVSWKEIAKELGNKRSYKVYSACTHSIGSRVRKRKAQKETMDPNHSQSLQRGNRSTKRDLAQGDGWIPGDDDLCLLQRYVYFRYCSKCGARD